MNTPANLSISTTHASMTLSWDAVTGATHYNVWRQSDTGTNWIWLAKTTGTSFTDYSADATDGSGSGLTWYYGVDATDGSATSSKAEDSATFSSYSNTQVESQDIGHPKYKISTTTYTATATADSHTATGSATAASNANDACLSHLKRASSRL